MTQSPATKLVNRAARAHLRPLGLQQRGQSREWLDDHGWWVIAVSFASPAYSMGAHLHVSADFMWHDRDYLVVAVGGEVRWRGHRLHGDPPGASCYYNAEDEFERCVEGLAERAAREIPAWREAFPSLDTWADYLDATAGEQFWRQYDAAVAAGLIGDAVRARRWFDRVLAHAPRADLFEDPEDDWLVQAQHEARSLREALENPKAFAAAANQRGQTLRRFLKLATAP